MVTLAGLKSWLNITGTDSDLKLNLILESVVADVYSYLGDITPGTKSDFFPVSSHKNTGEDRVILSIPNTSAILTVNGVAVGDYTINGDNSATIDNIAQYLVDSDIKGFFWITYTAGYNMPANMQTIIYDQCALIFTQEGGKDVLEEKMGPRAVSFAKSSESQSFRSKLRQFKPLCMRLW